MPDEHEPLTDADLGDFDALEEAATPGPWEAVPDVMDDGTYFIVTRHPDFCRGAFVMDTCGDQGPKAEFREQRMAEVSLADAAFVAHLRQAIRPLTAEVRRLRAVLAALGLPADITPGQAALYTLGHPIDCDKCGEPEKWEHIDDVMGWCRACMEQMRLDMQE